MLLSGENVTKAVINNQIEQYMILQTFFASQVNNQGAPFQLSSCSYQPRVCLQVSLKHGYHLCPTETIIKFTNSICAGKLWKYSQAVLLLCFTATVPQEFCPKVGLTVHAGGCSVF